MSLAPFVNTHLPAGTYSIRRKNPSPTSLNTLNTLNVKLYPQGIHIDDLLFFEDLNDTEGTPIDVNFTLNEQILSFSLNYNGNNISGEVRSDLSTKVIGQSVNLLIGVVKTDLGLEVICTTIIQNPITFIFLIENFETLDSITWTELKDPLQADVPTTCSTINDQLKKILQQNDINLRVELSAQTDRFGLNLGELRGIVTATESYPNGYPKELVGICDNIQTVTDIGVQTLYSFKPKLNKVLKGSGDTLFAQTNDINSMFITGLTDCQFYINIIAYCTYRYMLAGLSNNGDFSCKWLYANNYQKFLRNLRNSEFSAAIVIFTEPQKCFDFTNFNQYFINCDHK